MKLRIGMVVLSTALVALTAFGADKAEKSELATQKAKTSYALGMNMATGLKTNEIDIDMDLFIKGFKDVMTSKKTVITESEAREIIMALQKEMQGKMQEKMKGQAEKNKKEGDAFLAENKKKEGVKTLESGLQYKVITEGKGASPSASDTVTVHYKGTLIDGTEFDSSYKRNEPASFPVNGVIKGWTEALQLMKEGSKWQLFIPAGIAYGDMGRPGIPPNSVLIFDVELIKVNAKGK
jgi:FKBP-type peptidyl-prolyl cis-trans isomerase FklB